MVQKQRNDCTTTERKHVLISFLVRIRRTLADLLGDEPLTGTMNLPDSSSACSIGSFISMSSRPCCRCTSYMTGRVRRQARQDQNAGRWGHPPDNFGITVGLPARYPCAPPRTCVPTSASEAAPGAAPVARALPIFAGTEHAGKSADQRQDHCQPSKVETRKNTKQKPAMAMYPSTTLAYSCQRRNAVTVTSGNSDEGEA